MTVTPKGAARRQALLDAVVRVLEQGGPGAVTHRAVAAEAGVPLAAATYYFSSLDDMFVSALRDATEKQSAALVPLARASVTEVARELVDFTTRDRGAVIAQYELLFLAMRRDALKADAERWYGALESALAERMPGDDPETTARRHRAAWAIDGLVLQMLWRGAPSTVAETADALTGVLDAP
jgi:DNA-binding transcriptional regulator YbjK